MTIKELKLKYEYKKRILDKLDKRCITVSPDASEEDALKLANTFFKMNKKDLIIRKGYATKNGELAYFRKKLAVIGEKPVWLIYRK